MPTVIETFVEFADRQGCPYVSADDGNFGRGDQTFLFQNGARSNGETHTEPPKDHHELVTAKLIFAERALDSEVQQFDQFKLKTLEGIALSKRYTNLPTPGEDAMEQLKAGQKRIAKMVENVNALRAELDEITGFPEKLARKAKERDDHMARCDKAIADVNALDAPTLPEPRVKSHYKVKEQTTPESEK